MLKPSIAKNDRLANWLIGIFSVVVFIVVVALGKFKLDVELGFDVHIFATINAFVNASIALVLVAALVAVKKKHYELHKKFMITALVLSILFLLSYIAHHLLAGEAKFGDANHDGLVDDAEKLAVGAMRTVYLIIFTTHILFAALFFSLCLFVLFFVSPLFSRSNRKGLCLISSSKNKSLSDIF